ncbi:hypothetical protein DEU56DRAFT_770605 [Suillus clintonianus]|uniref:uncharacterized protein n=1 Tax=Suillus clintonianus TaxID=1904413 RepID=UPI001B86C7CA|nr:uncharacterized protein DEU56DRAFT_770605 [Suillus clintonianus]KAG2154818.1 hypothetical protein DEU56DRAFT_770605 [Suillus clintonianus]
MLIDTDIVKSKQDSVEDSNPSRAPSSLQQPPPTFEESVADHVLHFSEDDILNSTQQQGGEDPPDFSPYNAQFFTSHSGDIISHDPHLNDDGEALYRFLLSQALARPTVMLRCKGSHNETHTRMVHSRHNGQTSMKTEQYTEHIIDFDFCIDVGQYIFGEPTHWSYADSTPAYRGRMYQEMGISEERRKAQKSERKAAKAWDAERARRGFPPWIGSDYAWREDQQYSMQTNAVLKSSWTLRQWADDYCASRKYLKEFNYHKIAYGWNFEAIRIAAISVVNSTHYRGDLTVQFETSQNIVSVRSHNRLSRALSNRWIKFLLFLTLIYPFIWLFKRFHSRGGGRWDVCGGAYALKRVEQAAKQSAPDLVHAESPFRDVFETVDTTAQGSSIADSSGRRTKVVGTREGEWFRQWEGTIRRAVQNRLQDKQPFTMPDDQLETQTLVLDGY